MQLYYVEVYNNGAIAWHADAECRILHRLDGPAIVYVDGHTEWLIHGLRHRTDGPAVVYMNRTCEWYSNGKLHHEAGPAVVHVDGTKEWWLKGIKLTQEQHARRTTPAQEMTVFEIETALGYKVKVVK